MSNFWYRESLNSGCYTSHLLFAAIITIIILYPYVEEKIIRKHMLNQAENFAQLSELYPVEDLKYFAKCDKKCDINLNPDEDVNGYQKSNVGCWTPEGGQGKICMTPDDIKALNTRGGNK